MSCIKSLTSFTYSIFHSKKLPTLRLAFDTTERNKKLAAFDARVVQSNSRGKRKRKVFLCKGAERVKVKGKVVPTSFLKNERKVPFVDAKERRKRYS